MKTLLDIVTDPLPSRRDRFIVETAKAIVARNPRSSQMDEVSVARALCSAVRNEVYDVPLAPNAFGLLYVKLLEACVLYRTYGK